MFDARTEGNVHARIAFGSAEPARRVRVRGAGEIVGEEVRGSGDAARESDDAVRDAAVNIATRLCVYLECRSTDYDYDATLANADGWRERLEKGTRRIKRSFIVGFPWWMRVGRT